MATISSRQLLVTLVPSFSVLAALAAANQFAQAGVPEMTRDVAAIAKLHPLTGVLSNLGILLWCASASISLFTAIMLRDLDRGELSRFLFYSALLSGYLLLDDCFQFHEDLASRYLGFGQRVVFPALAISVATYLVGFRRVILRTNFGALLMALGFLSVSVGIDVIFAPLFWRFDTSELFFEDGAKWLGIACWCSYFVNTSYGILVGHLDFSRRAIRADETATVL